MGGNIFINRFEPVDIVGVCPENRTIYRCVVLVARLRCVDLRNSSFFYDTPIDFFQDGNVCIIQGWLEDVGLDCAITLESEVVHFG